jgi:PX domain
MITTKRSLDDFQFLRQWLQYENPSSWFPSLPSPDIDPCAIPSRPARSVLHFLEKQLDSFLVTLLRHPTVATHELLWEFFMVADLRRDLIIDRSKSKVENMTPAWDMETPLDDTSGLEIFFDHARGQVDRLRHAYQVVGRKAQGVGDALICTFTLRSHSQ